MAGITNYPGALDTTTNLPIASALVTVELNGDGNVNKIHSNLHGVLSQAAVAIEGKIGTGASTPIANRVLRGSGTGTSAWAQVALATDVSGTLPLASLATGALDSGFSITSGFGTINNGASSITTTGTLAAGATTLSGDTIVGNGYGLIVGHTAFIAPYGEQAEFQILGTSASGGDKKIAIGGFGNDNVGGILDVYVSRSTNFGVTPAIVQDNDVGFQLRVVADDGTDITNPIALIVIAVDDASPAGNAIGGEIILSTTTTAGASTAALLIDSSQNATFAGALSIPATDKLYLDGGSNTYIQETAGDNLVFHSGALALTLDSSQNATFAGSIATTIDGVALAVHSATSGQDVAIRIASTAGGNADSMLEFYEGGADRGGITWGGTLNQYEWDGGALNFSGGNIYIGDTANTKMTVGLTINQGANTNAAFELKATNVAQQWTAWTETDTYFSIKQGEPGAGGARITGLKDADGGASKALMFDGFLGEAADTTDTTGSGGVVHFNSFITNGTTGVTSIADAGNIFVVTNNDTARLLVKGNGDLHVTNTTLVALDDEDDIDLIRRYQWESSNGMGIAMSKWDAGLKSNRADLIRTGVWSSQGDFTVQQRMNDLLGGGIWQLNTKHMSLAEKVDGLEVELIEAKKQLAAISA